MTEASILILLSCLALGGIIWTAWDIRSDMRRHRLK
jgi:hypothetical protein